MAKNVNHIQHVKSNVLVNGEPKLPQPSALVEGEIAVNYADGYETLSIKTSSGNIATFSSDTIRERDNLVIAQALTDLNERKLDASAYTPTDLSNYYTKSETSGASEIAEALSAKADTTWIENKERAVAASLVDLNDRKLDASGVTLLSNTVSSINSNVVGLRNDVNSISGDVDTLVDQHEVIAAALVDLEDRKLDKSEIDMNTYYTKTEVDDRFGSGITTANTVTKVIEDNEVAIAAAINELDEEKQDLLVSGQNIKTINQESIIGSGDIVIESGFKKLVNPTASTKVGLVNSLVTPYSTDIGNFAVIEGEGGEAEGDYSHAEGLNTSASGESSHAEGLGTIASGECSHAEGWATNAYGSSSHAEGKETTASGEDSHAEGYSTKANGDYSHAEGQNTSALTINSHAEGNDTLASGQSSHAEGAYGIAGGHFSHAEGYSSEASGNRSHAEGSNTIASGQHSHAEGSNMTTASGESSHAEGQSTLSSGIASHAEGKATNAIGNYSHAEGSGTYANGEYSHAEGYRTSATTSYTHAEGYYTKANGLISHAEGSGTTASGNYSHSEGLMTIASGQSSHAEGYGTTASGDSSHAEGNGTKASGAFSHAEGQNTTASGNYSHAEGQSTTASGAFSHAEGYLTRTLNVYEHSSGQFNNPSQINTTFGNSGNTLFTVGNGFRQGNTPLPHNAFEIRQNGDIYIANTDETTHANFYQKNMFRLQDLVTGFGGFKIKKLTESEYSALSPKDPNTIYIVI